MLTALQYLVALGVAYLLVAIIANRQFGKNLPLPAFISARLRK